tara:strand:+ start:511 stop:1722 length:1212 start_codon:yes stop_codon:yes gene_type:complete
MKNNKKFSDKVLTDFRKESPSKINIKKNSDFKDYLNLHLNLFENLKFPVELFKNKKIVDLGCGTGEVDVVLNKFGGKLECVDFNKKSIDYANFIKKKKNLKNINFKNLRIEDYKVKKNFFDISISFGVINHVYDQEGLFKKLVNSTKKGGYIILGFVEDAGLIQRLLHRAIIRRLSKKNEKKVYIYAKQLFSEHLNRSVKFGMRTYRGIINDYLINQVYYGLSSIKLNGWKKKYNLKFYSSLPQIALPIRIDSATQNFDLEDKNLRKSIESLYRLRSIFAQNKDESVYSKLLNLKNSNISKNIETFIKDLTKILQNKNNYASKKDMQKLKYLKKKLTFEIINLIKNVEKNTLDNLSNMSNEITSILEGINNKNFSFKLIKKKIKYLFKGYNGLGTSYYIFKKD